MSGRIRVGEIKRTTGGWAIRFRDARGIRKQRGGLWRTRDIRKGVLDSWYAGKAKGYRDEIDDHEPMIDPDRWERIAAMVRTDERAAKGGRPALSDGADYLLRGIGACIYCQSSLYTRRLASGRHYVCRSRRESTGCDADYIPAEPIEQAVLDHLGAFVSNIREWIEERAAHNNSERARFAELVDQQRRELNKIDRRAQAAQEQYERLLTDDQELADAALRKATNFEAERKQLADTIAAADQRLAEWPAPDVDHELDVYMELQNTIEGCLSGSQHVEDLRATLRSVLQSAHLGCRDGALVGLFGLRHSADVLDGEMPASVLMFPSGTAALYQTQGEEPEFTVTGLNAGGREWVEQFREEPATTC